MKIVVAEKISASAVDLLREPRWTVITHDQLEGKLTSHLETADALIVRSAVQVDAALLEHAPKLRVVGRAGVGVDNVDLDAATRKGIAVMNTPGANAVAVAELTLGMMLGMARLLPRADGLMHAGKWEKKSLQGTELRGKILGVIGLGKIGMEVARRAKAFGMEIIGHDPFVSASVAKDQGIRTGKLEEVYAAADYLTLHVGLTPQTALENVILTPHIGGSTHEAQEAVGFQIALQVKEYLKSGVIQNAVNVPSVSHEEYAEMQPYVVLAERLGSFLAQVSDGTLEEISVRYSGHIAEWKTELIRNAAIKGVLNQMLDEKANLVNAAAIASSRGLQVHELHKPKSSTGGSGSVLSVLLKTGAGEHRVKGAVLHGH